MGWTIASLVILAVNAAIAVFSYFKIYRHRAIYGVEHYGVQVPYFEAYMNPQPINEQLTKLNDTSGYRAGL